jgi:hypothetical protein
MKALLIAEVFGSAQIFKTTLGTFEVLRALHTVDDFPDFLSVFFFHLFCGYLTSPLGPGSFIITVTSIKRYCCHFISYQAFSKCKTKGQCM